MNEVRRYKGIKYFVTYESSHDNIKIVCIMAANRRKIRSINMTYRAGVSNTFSRLHLSICEFHGTSLSKNEDLILKIPERNIDREKYIDYMIGHYAEPIMHGDNIKSLLEMSEMETVL